MSAASYRTLDVPERQCLVDFFDDDNFSWHHRILLHPGGSPGVWVSLTPDFEVGSITLSDRHVIVLGRNAPLPARRVNDPYCFDHELDEER